MDTNTPFTPEPASNISKPSSRMWLYVGITLVVVIVLIGVGAFVAKAMKTPLAAAKVFAQDIVAGNVEKAYTKDAGTDFQKIGTADDLKAFLDHNNVIGGKNISLTKTQNVKTDALVSGTMLNKVGSTTPLIISLTKQGSDWKVTGFSLTEIGTSTSQ
jgi:hypothetical protein